MADLSDARRTTTPKTLAPPLHCEQRSKKAVEVRGYSVPHVSQSL
jgi:hypothetical protein